MKILINTFMLIIAILGAPTAFAATYYVDFSGGSDLNDGLATTTAWQHAPGDVNAAGVPAVTVPKPGDTFVFKGGVVYIGQVEIKSSGLAGSVITYDGNSDGSWGTGPAQFNLNARYYHAFNHSSANHGDYIVIRNFDIYGGKNNNNAVNQTITRNGVNITGVNYNGAGDNSGNYNPGYIFNNLGNHWTISNVLMHESENWSDRAVPDAETDADSQTSAAVPSDQRGITIFNSSDITISGCEIWAIGRDGISIAMSSQVLISHCNFGGGVKAAAAGNEGWFSVAIRIYGAATYPTSNIRITGNTFHEGWQYEGDDAGQRSHAGDWIHIYGNGNGILEANIDPNNILIAGNNFYNKAVLNYANGTADSFLESDAFNITYANNIVVNPHHMAFETQGAQQVNFYNNTLLTFGGGGKSTLYIGMGTKDVTIRNNILSTTESNSYAPPLIIYDAGLVPVNDNNLFYASNLAGIVVRRSTVCQTLSAWQAADGNDAHSVAGDPLLDSSYKLRAGSPAIGAGSDLSSIFSTDNMGIVRNVPWDIGALKYKAIEDIFIAQDAHGADTGRDAANAHAAAWFNTAANWGEGSGKVSPGDTVHLCGTISLPLTIQGSGAIGSPVTIKFEDNAKISMPYFTGTYHAAILATGNNNINIDGGTNGIIETTDNGTNKTNQMQSIGIYILDQSDNWEIKNLHIGPMYKRLAHSSDPNAFGSGISFKFGGNNIKIHDNEISDAAGPVGTYGGANASWSHFSVYNNIILNFTQGIGVGQSQNAGHTGSISDINIYDNYLNSGNWEGSWPPHQGVDDGHHHVGGIHCYGGPLTSSFTGLKVYNNTLGPTMAENPGYLTSAIYLEYNIVDPLIYNNLIISENNGAPTNGYIGIKGGASSTTTVASNARIYNNTIYSSRVQGGTGIYAYDVTGLNIRNNLFYNVSYGIEQASNQTRISLSDHNLFYPEVQFRINGIVGYSVSQWQANGYDAGSLFNITPGLDRLYKPLLNAPIIDKGLNLSDVFTSDAAGNPRSLLGAWSMGAYEFTPNGHGDVSGDGRISMYDAALVLKYSIGGALTPAQQAQADMNGDAVIDAADAAAMAKKAVGIN